MGTRGYSAVGLMRPKDNANIGSVLRAAGCYGVSLIAVQGARYNRACTDTQKAYRHIPLQHVENLRAAIPYDCVPVAVEIVEGATSLFDYRHPERAFYVLGPEDGTLGRDVLDWCRDVVYVPTNFCMNLAATVNVVLYDRAAKQDRKPRLINPVPNARYDDVFEAGVKWLSSV
jgi:tRNA(Leu) C34 or U34 (ribose-2'-O)-methylase TrmL